MYAIRSYYENEPKVSVEAYSGLTVDYCKKRNALFMLRGIRTAADFEYERAVAQMNKIMFRITSYNVCYTKLLRIITWIIYWYNPFNFMRI